jgi:hypothetical protein
MGYPDVEKLLATWLPARLSVRVVTDTPSNLAQVLPVIQVQRFGGAETAPGIDIANIDVDVYAATRSAANTLAERARYALTLSLPGRQVGGATISRVATISGPSWRPYDNTALRRVGATYQLTVHASTIREVTP